MFRKYDKLISAASLANPKNNFLVRFRNQITDPTPYYLNNLTTKALPVDPFEVTLIATHLLRKTETDVALAKSIQSKEQHILSFKKQLGADIEQTASVLDEYVAQLKKLLTVDATNIPVQGLIGAVYVFEKTGKSDKGIYAKLLPELKNKLKYASYSNLADLTAALVHGKNYSDKALWTAILDALAAKSSQSQYTDVVYSAWDLDKYELPDEKQPKCEYLTENQQYYKDLVSGGEFSAEFSKQFRKAWDYLTSTWVQWLFFNERRVSSRLNQTPEEVDLGKLVQDLEEVGRSVPDLSAVVQKITGNIRGE